MTKWMEYVSDDNVTETGSNEHSSTSILQFSFLRRVRVKPAQKLHVSEEEKETVSRSSTRCSLISGGEREYFDPILVDVIINIFSKSPTKSMAKFRCVSKLWSSIVRPPYYKELFPIRSPPKFLFTFVGGGKVFYYTSPQPQDPVEDSSLVATRHHTHPVTNLSLVFGPVHGLVCHQCVGENYIVVVVSNPVTGQYVTLPKLMMTTKLVDAKSYLGFDPVEKQFKVLCVSWTLCGTEKDLSVEHQVLTLEKGMRNVLWRKMDSRSIPFCAQTQSDDGICINGILYYYTKTLDERIMIGCFDVRSERLDLIPFILEDSIYTLINYKGKLGVVHNCHAKDFVLWVLEEQEWSIRVYEKPLQWRRGLCSKEAVGVTDRGELLFCSKHKVEVPFYIFYYNVESNTVVRVRVEVPAFGSFKWPRLYTFPNYIEHVKLM
ncbi:unnamed protein product [Microthlaspi erraticum]|uniref:F-box domain-containing protein n=1 Tax=Microthlaspi erraticum TaxID=1685480 RepID=A0A6D2HWS6_9BRAS|nr:unnamed protein product [Microthlaspi erraticum]